MKISIIGTGYVGLISGACLASKGHDVTCIDILQEKVDKINNAIPPIYEKDLDELLKSVVGSKKLRATTDFAKAVQETDVSMIAVGTPFNGQEIDLTYIRQAAAQIGDAIKNKDNYHVVIVKSTVVPGTSEEVVLKEVEKHSGKIAGRDFGVGMNPEFLREGEAISDFMNPDRIVLGGIDERTIDVLEEMYSAFPHIDKIRTSPKTAEMIKYTANSLLASLISFSNEIGNLCTAVGEVDVKDVLHGVSLDKRFSPILKDGTRITPSMVTYLEAGCGFGGSCFPKDVKALIEYGRQKGSPTNILSSVIDTNRNQPIKLIDLLKKRFDSLDGLNVAVLGLAFKPGTDDIRESPALPVVNWLLEAGATVKAYDPIAIDNTRKEIAETDKMIYSPDTKTCVTDVDAIILVTSWPDFKIVPELISNMAKKPIVIDGRRFLDRNSVPHYEGIGL